MEQSWEDIWSLPTEMDMESWLEMCQEEEDYLGDYMVHQLSLVDSAVATSAIENSQNTQQEICHMPTIVSSEMNIVCSNESPEQLHPYTSSQTCIISFDNSAIIPLKSAATFKPPRPPSSSKNRTFKRLNILEPQATKEEGEKKITRSGSKNLENHSMGERKRRLELAHKFIELSATIPRLKKTDKASIVMGAINHVKQLQKRVKELEQQNKKGKEPMILLNKPNPHAIRHDDATTSKTINHDNINCLSHNEIFLPDVKARVLEKNIVIYINCEKQNGIEHKILEMLENLHLFVTSSSILPFGNSTLGITIIAKMGDAYKMRMVELVNNVRQLLLYGSANHPR